MEPIDLTQTIDQSKAMHEIVLPIMISYKEKRDAQLSEEEKKEFTKKLREIKKNSLDNIESLQEQTISQLEKNGIKVIKAKTPADAHNAIKEIIGKEKLIIKSKSNTANEINLHLALKDYEVVETDLGDFIVQITKAKDLHPVLPAVHLTPEEITKTIYTKFGKKISSEPETIANFVREHLREKMKKAKIGITGANVITADGSIFILENEGNISLTSTLPDKHIILSSFEKIVPTREDALQIIKAAANFGTGQNYPSYVNVISGPSKTADIQNKLITGAQGAKEVYLILLDNKRTEILNSEFKELLYCIHCGACVNLCPVYHQVFTRFGAPYFPGSNGIISSFFKESPKQAYLNGAYFCTTCKLCKENCPLNIDLSEMIRLVRTQLVKNNLYPLTLNEMMKNVKEFGNPFGKVKEGEIPDKLYCC